MVRAYAPADMRATNGGTVPLLLCDLIKLAGVELGRFKVHLATPSSNSPLDAYFDGRFEEWQEEQRRRNFQCETVIGLIHLGGSR